MKYGAQSLALALMLAAPGPASAEAPTTAPRASLAAVMPTASQALIFDRIQGEYVVVRSGDFVQGYRVSSVEQDQVVLTHPDAPSRHYVLATVSELRPVGERTVRCGATGSEAKAVSVSATGLDLIDPYGQDSNSYSNSYPKGVDIRTVLAPADQRAESPAPAAGQENKKESNQETAAPAGKTPSAVPVRVAEVPPTVVQPKRKAVPAHESHTIRRQEFDSALADFHALSKEVQIAVRSGKAHVVGIADGSYFHRLGLRKGDVLLSVAGQPVGSLDAAASVYARLMSSSRFDVVVHRGRQRVTLKYRFAD